MFEDRVTLFKLFGFKVQIDASWIIIALLVTWSLATGYFPSSYEGLSTRSYWQMSLIGTTGLFASIIFHEFCHSVVARRYGLPMKGITLFIFGGIAEMNKHPDRPKTEFLMAVAGPVASVLLGFGFHGLQQYIDSQNGSVLLSGVFGYLAFINWLLAGFNMLPAFPLDGGRILRSLLWAIRDDLVWATDIVCRLGSWFGIALATLGVIALLQGYSINGIWYILIGMFLNGAARASQGRVRKSLPSTRQNQ
ncbi:MAG: site-2 protease family protein [Deltaproteobacteria bacterium]|jgi:Zn-dependent protease|nr:site-2 protease family protein [Deltaproteobacteria bacterium]